MPALAIALSLGGLIVAGIETGALARLRVAWLVREGGIAGPIRIHEPETVVALRGLEPATSEYLIAHAAELPADDLRTVAWAQRLVRGRYAELDDLDAQSCQGCVHEDTERARLLCECAGLTLALAELGAEMRLPRELRAAMWAEMADGEVRMLPDWWLADLARSCHVGLPLGGRSGRNSPSDGPTRSGTRLAGRACPRASCVVTFRSPPPC